MKLKGGKFVAVLFMLFECGSALCPIPYTGPDCTKPISPCAPCHETNTEICLPYLPMEYPQYAPCRCIHGYNGWTCSERTSETGTWSQCAHDSAFFCGKHGTCVQLIGDAPDHRCLSDKKCICEYGFGGLHCDVQWHAIAPVATTTSTTTTPPAPTPPPLVQQPHAQHSPCSMSTCSNGGTCLVRYDPVTNAVYAECVCPPCTDGPLCTSVDDPCAENSKWHAMCKGNGGQCMIDREVHYESEPEGTAHCRARCVCPIGKTGDACEFSQTCNACLDNGNDVVCKNGGECRMGPGGSTGCNCKSGFVGAQCEHRHDPCVALRRAANMDKCYVDDRGDAQYAIDTPCEDANVHCLEIETCRLLTVKVIPTCVCPLGFTGSDCIKPTDPCATSPCLYGGTCQVVHSGDVNQPHTYTCLCPLNQRGMRCEICDVCSPNPCKNGGTCKASNFPMGTLGEAKNSSVVTDMVPAYTCHCPRGYRGPHCTLSGDGCADHICLHGGRCKMNTNTITNQPACACARGFTGDNCEKWDECYALNPCQTTQPNACQLKSYKSMFGYEISGVECSCDSLRRGSRCQFAAKQLLDSKFCEKHKPCRNGGQCTLSSTIARVNYQCICPIGTYGPDCETSACSAQNHRCFNGGKCRLSGNGIASCDCHGTPYTGASCDIFDQRYCDLVYCSGRGECMLKRGKETSNYVCHCYDMFEGERCLQEKKTTTTTTLDPHHIPFDAPLTCTMLQCGSGYRCVESGDDAKTRELHCVEEEKEEGYIVELDERGLAAARQYHPCILQNVKCKGETESCYSTIDETSGKPKPICLHDDSKSTLIQAMKSMPHNDHRSRRVKRSAEEFGENREEKGELKKKSVTGGHLYLWSGIVIMLAIAIALLHFARKRNRHNIDTDYDDVKPTRQSAGAEVAINVADVLAEAKKQEELEESSKNGKRKKEAKPEERKTGGCCGWGKKAKMGDDGEKPPSCFGRLFGKKENKPALKKEGNKENTSDKINDKVKTPPLRTAEEPTAAEKMAAGDEVAVGVSPNEVFTTGEQDASILEESKAMAKLSRQACEPKQIAELVARLVRERGQMNKLIKQGCKTLSTSQPMQTLLLLCPSELTTCDVTDRERTAVDDPTRSERSDTKSSPTSRRHRRSKGRSSRERDDRSKRRPTTPTESMTTDTEEGDREKSKSRREKRLAKGASPPRSTKMRRRESKTSLKSNKAAVKKERRKSSSSSSSSSASRRERRTKRKHKKKKKRHD